MSRVWNSIKGRYRIFYLRNIDSVKHETPCTICDKNTFSSGPNGRLSNNNLIPWCTNCWSLERHRGIREFWKLFPEGHFKNHKVLQFSDDLGIDEDDFCEVEISIYGSKNSLDIQHIDRPENHYDMVICNQVIEHVPDDKKAMTECLRVVKNDGFVQLGIPAPLLHDKTDDWGFPNPEEHGHYRTYGRDVWISLMKLRMEITSV